MTTERAPRHLLILGSTGSIGRQALEVLPAVPELRLVGLAAGHGAAGVVEQARAHGVREVCLHDAGAAAEAAALAPELAVHAGEAGIRELIAGAADRAAAEGAPLTVLNGVVGAAGLRATMATLEAGATLALANKESMVAGGPFVLDGGPPQRLADPPGGQRAQRAVPVHRGRRGRGRRGRRGRRLAARP